VAKIIIIGDSVEIAQFVEQNLEILQLLREAKTVNEELKAKFDKLNADIQAHVQADQQKDQQIAQITTDSQAKDQHIADLTNQVATLTAAEAATIQEVGTAVDQADAALNSPHP
jgi:predicted RNase H-like nuclease (RuvC/YqgF family)